MAMLEEGVFSWGHLYDRPSVYLSEFIDRSVVVVHYFGHSHCALYCALATDKDIPDSQPYRSFAALLETVDTNLHGFSSKSEPYRPSGRCLLLEIAPTFAN
uniref:Uncharacterized protein n=1 Tax=Timema poppense TaxID=170557 RepID=A0A7R9H268_TIMPO|nr:unnamed protein product [Timema poppensis]